jgi:hypothetical protein
LRIQASKENDVKMDWLDRFCRGGIIDYYINRTKELEMVQHHLMENFVDEALRPLNGSKGQRGRNKQLIDKLAKTIGEINHRLCEVGLSPPVIAKMLSLIPKELLQGDLGYMEKFFENTNNDKKSLWFEDLDKNNPKGNTGQQEAIKLDPSKAPTALLPAIDGVVNSRSSKDSNSDEATAQGDQRIF